MKKIKYDGWDEMVKTWKEELDEMKEFSNQIKKDMFYDNLSMLGLILMIVALLSIIVIK